ncbi:MAG: DsbA family protein [Alphaproteobacteria bacterium]
MSYPQLVVIFVLAIAAIAPARAMPVTVEAAMAERSLGKVDAKVTVIEYASLTCPHCAAFHRDVLPELKKQYIDTGKIRYVFRDFPLDGRAAIAAMAARCAPKERYFPFIDALFKTQEQWARAEDVHKALSPIARLAGMSQEGYEACVKNEALYQAIRAARGQAETEFRIESTPSFVVNGKKTELGTTFTSVEKVLRPLLK